MNCFFQLTAVMILSCISATAQQEQYHISHFNSENGLPQNSIKGIETDREGYLWLATEMGMARYDGKQFRIFDQVNTPTLKTDRILRMGLISDTTIFFESDDGKFHLIHPGKAIEEYQPDKQTKKSLDSFSIYNAYTLYDNCLAKINAKENAAWILPDQRSITRSLHNSIAYIGGRYFYFNENGELISVDPALSGFKKLEIKGPLAIAIRQGDKQNSPISLLVTGNKLFLRYKEWIYFLETGERYSDVISSKVLPVGDIPNISCFKRITEKNTFYVGTMSDGVYVFQKNSFSTLRFSDIESNVFYAQAPFEKEGVLTKKGVLLNDRVIPMPLSGVTSESIVRSDNNHYFVNIWKSKQESGIAELDDKLNLIRYIPESDLHVNCFRQLKNGTIWIGGDKYFLGKIDNGKLVYVNRPQELSQNFSVRCFIQTGENELWVAGAIGLARIDTAGKKAFVVPQLSGIFIRALYQDKNGTIWIGSYGKGFYAWYKNRLVHLPIDKNGYLATAHSFMEDKKGFLWITTNIGLFQASLKDLYEYLEAPSSSLYYQYYDQSAGFLSNEFNGGCTPSGIELGDGRFSFPTMKSLVQFYPDSINPTLPNGPIHLDAIVADTIHIEHNTDSIHFKEDVNHIQFFISSPYFGNPYNQEIEYKISELDDDWYPMDDDGIIQINKPPAGAYKLLLRKKSGFGRNNYINKAVIFFIQPNFRETYAFKVLWILLFFALAYMLYRIRVGFLLTQKETLEKEVTERTKEQEYLIENLEHTIRELEDSKEESYQNNLFRQKLAVIITHDLQSPLRFLLDAVRRVHKKSLQNQYGDLTATSEVLQKATEEIYHFVEDFGLWLSSLDKDFNLQNETINLDGLLVELEQFFSEQLKAKENKLFFPTYKPVFVYTDRQLLKIVLRNIIDNANKHTSNGTIEIITHAENGFGTILIKDNGRGMTKDLISKITQRLNQKVTDYKERESGYGYRFIIDFSRLLQVKVHVESELGQGTIITLSNFKMTNG